jgi:nucleoid-associated protein YgaU
MKTASIERWPKERGFGKEKAVAEERERCAAEKAALAKGGELPAEKVEAAKPPEPPEGEKAPVEKPAAIYHEVTKGDCLWKIAEEVYGDPYQWPLIFKANRGKIRNPNLIYPKQSLKILKT